jgi:hypothetical protein
MRDDNATSAAGGGGDFSPVRRRSLQLDVDDVTSLTKTLSSPSHSRNYSMKQQLQAHSTKDTSVDYHQLKPPVPVWGVDKMRRMSLPSGSQAFALAADEIIAQTKMAAAADAQRDSSIADNDSSSPFPNGNASGGASAIPGASLQPPVEHHLMRSRSGSDVGGLKLNSILKKNLTNFDSTRGASNGGKPRLKPYLRVSFSDLQHNGSDGDTAVASTETLTNLSTNQQQPYLVPPLQQKTRRHSFPLIEYSPAAYRNAVDTYPNGAENHIVEDGTDLEDKENSQQQSSSSSSVEDVSTNKPDVKIRRSSVTSITSQPDDGIVCMVVHSFTPKRAHTRRALPPIRTDLKTLQSGTAVDATSGGNNLSVMTSSSHRRDLQSVSPSRRLPPIPATPRVDEETAELSLHHK